MSNIYKACPKGLNLTLPPGNGFPRTASRCVAEPRGGKTRSPATPGRGEGTKKGAATCSPACQGSTIGAGGLNCSVRDGKRWDTAAMAARNVFWEKHTGQGRKTEGGGHRSFGQLVALGFDVAVFTPAPYQRRRLRRPS